MTNYTPETVRDDRGEPLLVPLRLSDIDYPSHLHVSRYYDDPDTLALVATDPDTGELNATLSVNLHGEPPEFGCIWVKDWSENEGVWDALIELGLAKRTGRVTRSGWVAVHEARLTGAAKVAVDALAAQAVTL